jgi:hypothetical protein
MLGLFLSMFIWLVLWCFPVLGSLGFCRKSLLSTVFRSLWSLRTLKIVLNICSLVHTYALASRLLSKCMLLVFSFSFSSISQSNMRWSFVWSPWVQTHSGDWIVLKRCRCAFVFQCAVTIADIYLLLNYSSCFGRPSRPSSGVHKTIVGAFGTDHTIWGASYLKRDQIRTKSLFGHVAATVFCSADDGRLKHVE